MAKDDFDPEVFGHSGRAPTEVALEAAHRQKTGPLRRTHRPAASAEVNAALDQQLLDAHGQELEDHEKRLRDLEAFKWKLVGASAVAGGLGMGLAKLLGG